MCLTTVWVPYTSCRGSRRSDDSDEQVALNRCEGDGISLDDTVEISSTKLQKDLNSLDFFVIERVEDGKEEAIMADNPIQPGEKTDHYRWVKYVRTVYVIEQSMNQVYIVKSLEHNSHYHVKATEKKSFLKRVSLASERKPGGITVVIIPCNKKVYEDEFLSVCNNLRLPIAKILKFPQLRCQLLAKGFRDKDRHHVCMDIGYTGYRNSKRTDDTSGVSKPEKFKLTDEHWAKQSLLDATSLVDKLVHGCFHKLRKNLPGNKIHFHPGRNEFGAGKIIAGNRFESGRMAQGSTKNHFDKHNCKQFSHVVGFSCPAYNFDASELHRYVLVLYCKKDVLAAYERFNFYSPIVESVKDYYDTLPEELKSFSSQQLVPVGGKKYTTDIPHTLKVLTYSNYRNAIELVLNSYPRLRQPVFLDAFLVAIPMDSGCLDHYIDVCKELAESGTINGIPLPDCEPVQICLYLEESLHDRKLRKANSNKKKKDRDPSLLPLAYDSCQRIQPNFWISRDKFNREEVKQLMIHSLSTMSCLYKHLANTTNVETEVERYYELVVSYISKQVQLGKPGGVYGAGSLTAQHVVGVASVMLYFPVEFLTVAEVATGTDTWKFLKEHHGFTDEMYCEQAPTLLKAIAHRCSISLFHAEEMLCSWKQHHQRSSVKRYHDTFFPGFNVYQYDETIKALRSLEIDGTMNLAEPVLNAYFENVAAFGCDSNFWNMIKPKNGKFYSKKKARTRKHRLCESFFPLKKETTETSYLNGVIGMDSRQVVGSLSAIHFTSTLLASKICFNAIAAVKRVIAKRADASDGEVFVTIRRNKSLSNGGQLQNLYCCGLKLLGRDKGTQATFPPSIFPLVPTYKVLSKTKKNNEDPIASVNILISKESDRVWFDDIRAAKKYASIWMIICYPQYFGDDKTVKHIRDSPKTPLSQQSPINKHAKNTGKRLRTEKFSSRVDTDSQGAMCQGWVRYTGSNTEILYYKVFCDVGDQSRLPFCVALKYRKGGVAYYMTDEFGRPSSKLFLCRPSSMARRYSTGNLDTKKYEFRGIISHHGPIRRGSMLYKGSSYNLYVQWIDGKKTLEPLNRFSEEALFECYQYGQKHGLLELEGWKNIQAKVEGTKRRKVGK